MSVIVILLFGVNSEKWAQIWSSRGKEMRQRAEDSLARFETTFLCTYDFEPGHKVFSSLAL